MNTDTDIELSSEPIAIDCVLFDIEKKLYVEASLGLNMATYWTDEINEALVLKSVDDAVEIHGRLSRNNNVKIQELITKKLSKKRKNELLALACYKKEMAEVD